MYPYTHHAASESVTCLLADAVGSKKPAYRSGIYAYFPLQDIPGYALRVDNGALRNDCTRDIFKYCSSLTPPELALTGPAVGQTALETPGGNAALVHMPAGHSLDSYFHSKLFGKHGTLSALPTEAIQQRHLAAATSMMKELLALGDSTHIETNPFVPLFERAYELSYLGFQPDLQMKHLFYDRKEATLALFYDFSEHTHSSRTDPRALRSALDTQCDQAINMFAPKFGLPAGCDEYKHTFKAFEQAIKSAKQHVLKTHLRKDVPSPFAFADTHKIEGVVLTSPSYELKTRLQQIETLHQTTAVSK